MNVSVKLYGSFGVEKSSLSGLNNRFSREQDPQEICLLDQIARFQNLHSTRELFIVLISFYTSIFNL